MNIVEKSKSHEINNDNIQNANEKRDGELNNRELVEIMPEISFEGNSNDEDDDIDIMLAPGKSAENIAQISNENKKKNKFSWVRERFTKDLDEAVDSIFEEGFKLYDSNDLKCGQKFYFRCGRIPKSRKQWCNKRYNVFLPAHNDDIEVLSNGCEHNHDDLLKGKKRPVSDEMTAFIHEFYTEGRMKPSDVIAYIKMTRDKFKLFIDEPDPDRRQLEYIHKKFIANDVKPMIKVGDLMQWCKENSKFPTDHNEAFVLSHESSSIGENMSWQSWPKEIQFVLMPHTNSIGWGSHSS